MSDEGPQKDGPPRGKERWKEETKGIERIIEVFMSLSHAETAGKIAEEAMVSEQTAREHLDMFADLGVIAATTASGVTKYQPDSAWVRFKEVSKIIESHSKDEILEFVERYQMRISDAKEDYSVESPDELRAKAAEEGATIEEIREYKKRASEWETLAHELTVYQEALERYEEFDRGVAVS